MRTRKALMEEIERLNEEVRRWRDIATEKNKTAFELREQLEKVNRGERCYGGFCAQCKHGIEGDRVEIRTPKGDLVGFGKPEIICEFCIHCPDFQRKEE